MTSKEIDRAMREKMPVVYGGIRYDRIAEYILWYDRLGNKRLSVTLVEGNTAVRVSAEKVEVAEC